MAITEMESYTDAIREFERFSIKIDTEPVRKFWVAGDKLLKVSVKVYGDIGGPELAQKSVKLEVRNGNTTTINNLDTLEPFVSEFTPEVYKALFSSILAPSETVINVGTEYPSATDKKQLYFHLRPSMEGFAKELANGIEKSVGMDFQLAPKGFTDEIVSNVYTEVIELLHSRIDQEKEKIFWAGKGHQEHSSLYVAP